jgi:hypothetical protein
MRWGWQFHALELATHVLELAAPFAGIGFPMRWDWLRRWNRQSHVLELALPLAGVVIISMF